MYDPNHTLQNLEEVSDFIGKLHQQDPEFYFSEAKPIDFSQNGVRLYGHIGTKQKPDILNSMDFFIIEEGKAAHLYVFMEPTGNDNIFGKTYKYDLSYEEIGLLINRHIPT
jgi:hypothetical protein